MHLSVKFHFLYPYLPCQYVKNNFYTIVTPPDQKQDSSNVIDAKYTPYRMSQKNLQSDFPHQ